MRAYHDDEWGRPVAGESAYLERLTLEAFQSGLSWRTILMKRPAFRMAFHDFDADRIAAYDDADVGAADGRRGHRPQPDEGERRGHQRPGDGGAARARWAGGAGRKHRPESWTPPATPTTSCPRRRSLALSKSLKKAGFAFVGPTTMHALMEAIGLVDDHLVGCHASRSS